MRRSNYELPFAADSVDAPLLLNVLEHLVTSAEGLIGVFMCFKALGLLLFGVPFVFPLQVLLEDCLCWTS